MSLEHLDCRTQESGQRPGAHCPSQRPEGPALPTPDLGPQLQTWASTGQFVALCGGRYSSQALNSGRHSFSPAHQRFLVELSR